VAPLEARHFGGRSAGRGRNAGILLGQETGVVFLALMPTPERFWIDGRNYRATIIPTAPVPVGGGLIFVPADGVKPADVSVDSFMSIYVSMGVTAKQFMTVAA